MESQKKKKKIIDFPYFLLHLPFPCISSHIHSSAEIFTGHKSLGGTLPSVPLPVTPLLKTLWSEIETLNISPICKHRKFIDISGFFWLFHIYLFFYTCYIGQNIKYLFTFTLYVAYHAWHLLCLFLSQNYNK